jgi:hypothetical protein
MVLGGPPNDIRIRYQYIHSLNLEILVTLSTTTILKPTLGMTALTFTPRHAVGYKEQALHVSADGNFEDLQNRGNIGDALI